MHYLHFEVLQYKRRGAGHSGITLVLALLRRGDGGKEMTETNKGTR